MKQLKEHQASSQRRGEVMEESKAKEEARNWDLILSAVHGVFLFS